MTKAKATGSKRLFSELTRHNRRRFIAVPSKEVTRVLFHGGLSVVFLGCAGLAALWLVFAVTMRNMY